MEAFYYCSDKQLIGGKPYNNAQGIHMSKDIETCKNLKTNRKYESPHFYKFTVTFERHPFIVNHDYGAWYADDIATSIYRNKSLYKHLDEENKSIVDYYRYTSIDEPKMKTKIADFKLVVSVLKDHGYNCIDYKNTYEKSKKRCLFNNIL